MPQNTEPTVKVELELPAHVHAELDGWAAGQLDESVEGMLEVVAYELVRNAELRAFATGLVGE